MILERFGDNCLYTEPDTTMEVSVCTRTMQFIPTKKSAIRLCKWYYVVWCAYHTMPVINSDYRFFLFFSKI